MKIPHRPPQSMFNVLRSGIAVDVRQRLFGSLHSQTRRECAEISLMEFAAIMRYYTSGEGQKGRPWLSLSRAAKVQWLPDNALTFLQSNRPAVWADYISCYGEGELRSAESLCRPAAASLDASDEAVLQSLCQRFPGEDWRQLLVDSDQPHLGSVSQVQPKLEPDAMKVKREPEESPKSSVPTLKSEMQDRPLLSVAAPVHVTTETVDASYADQPVVTSKMLEGLLFRGLPAYTPIAASMLNIAQVMRGIVASARGIFGDRWHEHVCLLDCGNEGYSSMLGWQFQVPVLIGLLYSRSHWSLLTIDRRAKPPLAATYSGVPDDECQDLALTFLMHVVEKGWLSRLPPIHEASVPRQKDAWSCGHRAILAADYILSAVEEGAAIPVALGPDEISADLIKALIHRAEQCSRASRAGSLATANNQPAVEGEDEDEEEQQTVASLVPSTPPRVRPNLPADDAMSPAAVSNKSTPRRRVSRAAGSRAPSQPAASAKKACKKPRLTKKDESMQLREATAACELQGINHNVFQSRHRSSQAAMESGHWKVFLQCVLDAEKPLLCHVCKELRACVLGEVAEASAAASSQQIVPRDGGNNSEPVHTAGRPKKGEVRWSLHKHIAKEAMDVYRQTPESFVANSFKYHCLACKRDIKFRSQTCSERLFAHERVDKHKQGLARLRGSVPQEAQLVQQEESSSRDCPGVSSKDKTLPLHPVAETLAIFTQAGQPTWKYADQENNPLAEITLLVDEDVVILRNRQCEKTFQSRLGARKACLAIASKREVWKALAVRTFLVDLAHLSFKLQYGSDAQIDKLLADIRARDYLKLGLAGSELEDMLRKKSKLEQIRAINKKFSFPAWRVTPSLRSLIDHWLVKSPTFHGDDIEAAAHASLVKSLSSAVETGAAQSSDLALAAKVASGRLRADSVVEGLVTSFLMTFKDGLHNKRYKTSGRYANYGAIAEALLTLGKREEVNILLEIFCVNPRKLPKSNALDPSLPQPFLALANTDVLQKNASISMAHMKLGSERPFLVFDETVYSPSWELMRGIQGGDVPKNPNKELL